MDINYSARPTVIRDGSPTQPLSVTTRKIRYLYQNMPTAIAVNVLLAILMTWVLWERVHHSTLLYWFSILIFISVLRSYNAYRFLRSPPGEQGMLRWQATFLAGSTLSGLTWGITIWLFAPFNDFETPVFIAFALGGLTTGAAAVLGVMLRVYFTYTVVVMAPITAWFLFYGTTLHTIMGGMLSVYIIAMLATGYIYRKILLNSFDLSDQLIKAKEKAETANEAKSRFISSMSHELRTPLNAILGFGQILQMNKAPSDNYQEDVDEIVKAGRHLLNLINDLLDLAKIESEQIDLDIGVVDCAGLIEECLGLITPLTVQYDVNVIFNKAQSKNEKLRADQFRLKQVLLNLLSNAYKYNNPGGSIFVQHAPVENNRVRISVRDTGLGIPLERQTELFQPYNRLGQQNSAIEGTGIGLAIAKQLIEMMGGEIGFDSYPGKGSTFWVEIPCDSEGGITNAGDRASSR